MIRRLAMVMGNKKTIPDEIIYTYVAFLKNSDKIKIALGNYYEEPTGIGRTRLIQEIARPQSGTYSEKIIKANKVIEQVLDIYNTVRPIICLDADWIDLDFDEEIDLMFACDSVVANNINYPFKRIKQ